MEENKTPTAAAAEATIDSIKKLMDAIGNDNELKQKLEDTLATLTGKTSAKEEDDAGNDTYSDNNHSDIFNEDALAGMVVGFVAGAAVVGGGVLLHKLITSK